MTIESPAATADADQRTSTAPLPEGRWSTASELIFSGIRLATDLAGTVRERLASTDGPPDGQPATRSDGAQPRGLVLRPALLGFVAILAICVGASLPTSPFKLEMPGTWFFGVPSRYNGGTWGVYFSLAAVYGGLLLLIRVWWGMSRLYARCPGVPVRRMGWVFALWSLPMMVIAPIFSRDVYSYAAQGEMVSHNLNPYLYGPDQLGNNTFTAPVDPLWGNAPAPYGPLFLQIDGFFAKITFHNELATVVLLRLLAYAGVLLIAFCVPRLASLYHRDKAELFTLVLLNPVTLLYLVAGAHNDALMLGLLLAGIVAAKRKRPIVGILLVSLATAIKAPAAIGLLYIGWSWLGDGVPIRQRIRPVVTAGLIGLAVLGFFSYTSGLGWGWVTNLDTPGVVRSWTAPATAVAFVISGLSHLVGLGVGVGGVLTVARFFGMVIAAIVGVWLLVNSDRIGTLKALGLTMLAFVLLGPVDQPWYLAWGIILLAPVAHGRLRSAIIGVSIFSAFVELPGAAQLLNSLIHGDPLSIVLTLLWVLFILTVPLSTWERPATLVVPSPRLLTGATSGLST
jgi:alpha-1,6-mannosyltransferase